MTADSSDFVARQDAHFADADRAHFDWQTRGPGFAGREADFITRLLAGARGPLLEIGCGEGANLFHAAPAFTGGTAIGVDRSAGKLRFAAREVAWARYCCSDATALPFRSHSFETVVVRDVLHHLTDPRATVAEAVRVLRPGGRFVLAEPNARSPLIRLQMALVPAERGAARSTEGWLRDLLEAFPLADLELTPAAPFPLDRVVLHPTFGLPRLGQSPLALRLLGGVEAMVGRLLGPRRWSYLVARARARGPDGGDARTDMRA